MTLDSLRKVNLEQVATKQDLLQLKVDLLKWLIPLLLAQVALFAGFVKLT